MENFHPLRQTPSHADALNSAHWCGEFAQDCVKLRAQKNVSNLYRVHIRKIFCWPFFSCFKNLVDVSLATFLIFLTFFLSLAIFLTVLGYSHQSHALKFPCTQRIVTLMRQVRRKPYCAGHTLKFLAQSHYYTRHIRHNVYFFQSGRICPYYAKGLMDEQEMFQAINFFSFIPMLYCLERHSTRYVYWWAQFIGQDLIAAVDEMISCQHWSAWDHMHLVSMLLWLQ